MRGIPRGCCVIDMWAAAGKETDDGRQGGMKRRGGGGDPREQSTVLGYSLHPHLLICFLRPRISPHGGHSFILRFQTANFKVRSGAVRNFELKVELIPPMS